MGIQMKKAILIIVAVIQSLLVFSQTEIKTEIGDNHEQIKGTKISMVRPTGFTEAANFAGFQQDESGASIMVLDLPAPFSEVSKAFSEEALLSQGMVLLTSEEIILNGMAAFLLTVEQKAYGQTFKKHILALGKENETILINGTFPIEKTALDNPVKAALLTTFFDADKEIDPFENIDFEINAEGSGLIFAKSMANMLVFSRDGKIPSLSEDQANFMVGKAFSEVALVDKKQYTINRMRQLPVDIETIISTEPITIDGLSGFEIIANGKNREKGNPEKLYQIMLFDETLYYIMLGSSEADFDENIATFQKMAKTFKRK